MKLDVSGISKSFGKKGVLNDISFSVGDKEIFGLLGPNGAGKTTMIRIVLDILGKDSGKVRLFGKEFSEGIKEKIGYLPEEGSIYRDTTIFDAVKYFSSLKGAQVDEPKLRKWLERFDLWEHREKKIQDLSKGMQRKLLFIIAVIHDPDILILDEPFSGLDPINRQLVKDVIMDLKSRGMSIIMSTHQMDEVERMCDRILMINKGQSVLYGRLDEIKKKYGFSVFVEYSGKLPKIAEAERINDFGKYAEIILKKGKSPQSVMKRLSSAKAQITKFEVKTRSLDDIFIEVVKNG